MKVHLCIACVQPNVCFQLLMLHLDGVAEHYHHLDTTVRPGRSMMQGKIY